VRSRAAIAAALVLLIGAATTAPTVAPTVAGPAIQGRSAGTVLAVYFSPNGGATGAVVEALGRAREHVLVIAYTFTSAPIARALVEAHRRGVVVEVILDRKEARKQYSSADFLAHMDIPTFVDGAHAITHDKVMVIDGHVVITGSFNFTTAAERQNAENLLIIHDDSLAKRYADNWSVHVAHSVRYAGR
jgi:phosphatidylserine/phosphatidylglycerophosphate/cardiolipin synthase-like enzyme